MFESIYLAGAATALAAAFTSHYIITGRTRSSRRNKVRPAGERVLILGASSGVGRALTKQYAARGARVCAVARREGPLADVVRECSGGDSSSSSAADERRVLSFAGDFAEPTDMESLRTLVLREWGGLDTLHVCAGVSAVQPFMALTGGNDHPDAEGVGRAVDIAGKAARANFFGPLVAAATFLPMLRRTSVAPAVLLVSSVAAVVPAPTRALYAATKAAALLLFQSLAIEHPDIAFAFVLPATIEGNFRSSAVDADIGPVVDETEEKKEKKGLKPGYVATRCAEAVDSGSRGNVVIPWFPYALAHYLYYLWPSLIERQARKKYGFTP